MQIRLWLIASLALTLCSISPSLSVAQMPANSSAPVRLATPHPSPAQVYGKLFSSQAEEVVAAAEAMPAEKYNFVPTSGEFKGVRTFAQQITHVAEAQYFFFKGFGVKPGIDPEAITKLTSKEDIVKALKDSYAFAQQAVATITPENAFEKIASVDGTDTRATIAAFALAHTDDHYGQMVVYLRMNGIVPPASRK
jgi:uncharacterized damage-inducible protein DinB